LETTLQKTSDLGEDLMVNFLGGKSDATLSSLHRVTFTNKVATAKAFVTPKRLPQHSLKQAFIVNECTFKSWYNWGWPVEWTQLNRDGNRKEMS
jgi:hypothetical protein